MRTKLSIVSLSIAILISFTLTACESEAVDVKELTKKDDGIYYSKNDKPFSGKAKRLGDSGNILSEANFKDGKLHGSLKSYYESGKLKSEENFKDGKPHGVLKFHYENGNPWAEKNYKDGEFHGVVKTFYENGKPETEANYKDGKMYGVVKSFYENGNLKSEGNYEDDKEHGVIKLYYENGKLKGEANYKAGILDGVAKSYSEDGKLESETEFANGKRKMETFTDKRDGKKYNIVKIGDQTWMAENLNYASESSACYDKKPENCKKYGALYFATEAQEACPDGWHLPNPKEWRTLIDFAGGVESAGKKLKSKTGWSNAKNNRGETVSQNGTDDYDFTALPSGIYMPAYSFVGSGSLTAFWTNSTRLYATITSKGMEVADIEVNSSLVNVRCVKDLTEAEQTALTAAAETKIMEAMKNWSETLTNGKYETWDEASKLCSSKGMRLPTNEEWEIVAKAIKGSNETLIKFFPESSSCYFTSWWSATKDDCYGYKDVNYGTSLDKKSCESSCTRCVKGN
jgi:uncharacterized protein (TIGR02145 family)